MRPLPILLLLLLGALGLAWLAQSPKGMPALPGGPSVGEPSDSDSSSDGLAPSADMQGITNGIGQLGGAVGAKTSVEAGEVEQVATRLLCSYRDAGDCVLSSSGYLDLLGSVWGCVVAGDGWVDVCVVSRMAEDGSCQVSVLHMDADEVGSVMGDETDGAWGQAVP